MANSKNIIPLEVEECIRRFAEDILHISARENQVKAPTWISNTPVTISHVEHRATQTDPVMITISNGTSSDHSNAQSKEESPSTASATPSSQLVDEQLQEGIFSDLDIKKSVLDSLLLQSPKASGLVPPVSTPTPLTPQQISEIISDQIDGLPASSTFTLLESRHAPKNRPPTSGSKHYHAMSHTDRIERNQSFSRMSFQAADSSSAMPRTPSVLGSTPNVHSPAAATSKTSPASVSSKTLSSPWSDSTWVPPHLRGLENLDPNSESKTATATSPNSQAKASGENEAIREKVTDRYNVESNLLASIAKSQPTTLSKNDTSSSPAAKPASAVFKADAQPSTPSEVTAPSSPTITSPPAAFKALSAPSPITDDKNSGPLAFKALSTPSPLPDDKISGPSAIITSSVNSPAVLPISLAAANPETKENREKDLYFTSWGKPEGRTSAVARVRKVLISFPVSTVPTPSVAASLVWGGQIEEIHMDEHRAQVTFAYADDCDTYFKATMGRVDYKGDDGRTLVAFVKKDRDVNVSGGKLLNHLDQGFTRCIRAINILPSFTTEQLWAKARYKNRKVEGIEQGKTATDLPYVIFRFCKIDDAVSFKLALQRDEEWEHCNIHHVPDPCALATGVHF